MPIWKWLWAAQILFIGSWIPMFALSLGYEPKYTEFANYPYIVSCIFFVGSKSLLVLGIAYSGMLYKYGQPGQHLRFVNVVSVVASILLLLYLGHTYTRDLDFDSRLWVVALTVVTFLCLIASGMALLPLFASKSKDLLPDN